MLAVQSLTHNKTDFEFSILGKPLMCNFNYSAGIIKLDNKFVHRASYVQIIKIQKQNICTEYIEPTATFFFHIV